MKRGLWALLLAAAMLAACGGDGGGDGGPKCKPVEGHCNGLDDDCDELIDEEDEIAADLAALRSAGPFREGEADCAHPNMKGVCAEGVASCINGAPKCEPLGMTAAANDKTCDGFDDDCNGKVDDGVDLTSRDNCGGCGEDAAGSKTIHYCKRDGAGVALEECRDGQCVEANCVNGQDDDDDGYVDCADPDCAGESCGAPGFVCDNTAAGEGTCSCGLGYEDCTNRIDDDCDGRIDCADSGCLGEPCSATNGDLNCGRAPGATQPSCVERERDCGNGVDDDGDGQKDCLDEDCMGLACGSGLNCGTVGGAPTCLATEAACTNGADDDGDGAPDCEDTDCVGLACSNTDPGKNCGHEGNVPGCVGRETACGDGEDDDGDGRFDCEDPDCDGAACGAGCTCIEGIASEVNCGDLQLDLTAIDNDGDGQANCADLDDCLDETCGPGCLCVLDGDVGRPRELRCGDFQDNDGDNLQDCLDPDCAEQDCSEAGSPGCRCEPCPGGGCPTGEVKCEDGIDNDGDAQADCADPDCDGLRCWNTDGCVCARGLATEGAGSCGDGVDNDHDNALDCADSDCAGRSCGTGCGCANGVAVELPANCGDGVDNDGDGKIDCADPDCAAASCGQGCVCENLLPTETASACGDGNDNDGDSLTDCADLDCTEDSCGIGCLCVAEGGLGRPAETICGDRNASGPIDNDGDQVANCDDADCEGLGCGTGVAPIDVDDCRCVAGVATEIDCANGADDDLDGVADCADSDCHDKAPCPLITEVLPAEGPSRPAGGACGVNHPHQALRILGRHLGVDATDTHVGTVAGVSLGGVACLNVVAVSPTEITCETPAHAAGRVAVEVVNTGNFPGSLSDAFTFTTGADANIYSCRTDSATVNATANTATPELLGRVSEPEVTDIGAPPANPFVAQVGFGPAGSQAECDPAWRWFPANLDAGAEPSLFDHYRATFTAPAAGTYALQYRFTRDGIHWLYCDADTVTPGLQTGTLVVAP